MLDRCKLIREINEVSDKLFVDFSNEINIAKEIWDKISKDPVFKYKIKHLQQSKLIIPDWQGDLCDVFKIEKDLEKYVVLSSDGSQIYPDRHSGTFCHLINIGYVAINYGVETGRVGVDGQVIEVEQDFQEKRVYFNSEPHVFSDMLFDDFQDSPVDLVNCSRQDYEFLAGYDLANRYKNLNKPMIFLFDGSIIFWHLEAKVDIVKKYFLEKYLSVMNKFYEDKILMAGYISLTKSKELLSLIRVALCDFNVEDTQAYKVVDCISDAMIAGFYLKEFERTIVFKNTSKITENYPEHLKPNFFYMNVGYEIARIEIPAWIANDQDKVDQVATIIADQTIKGMGYPVAIAEAHEQAVVKGADREFFYYLINKKSFEQNRELKISQKSRKKLGMGV